MKKKIVLALGAVGTVAAMLPLFAAFEAHVINVTARIENALSVPIHELTFGTVFPQEKLDKFFDVSLSQSFQDEVRVDDIDYVIRQKPKCANSIDNPTEFSTVTEETVPGTNGEPETRFVCSNPQHVMLPLLCPYLSKHEVTQDGKIQENDSAGIPAFHGLPGPWTLATTLANEVAGHLAKSQDDLLDTWDIDLKVPCFIGHCAQDWAKFVTDINPDVKPDDYIQPANLEHKTFGCDLWLEVKGISLPPGFGCKGKVDVMLVLDRSGSIDSAELAQLKTAAKAFVDALALSTDGTHAGEVSFGLATASLDQPLTDDPTAVKNAIDALASSGLTNYQDALDTARAELAGTNDRNDSDSPDIIIMVTDGEPTAGSPDPQTGGTNSANAAKGDGIEIFAVGVGINASGTTYLKTNIVSSPDSTHYFEASDYGSLSTVLTGLTQCD